MKRILFLTMAIIFLLAVLPLKTLDTWMPADIRLDTGDTPGAASSNNQQITCTGDHVYVVWDDGRNGLKDIYFNYSSDNGINWQSSASRLDTGDSPGANTSDYPQIAYQGTNVYAAWQDARNGLNDIYFNYSTDNGVNWQATDIRLDTGDSPGANGSHYPQIACSGNSVYMVWSDARDGNWDIYLNYSNDNGITWQASDVRLDTTGEAPGVNWSSSPQIACSGNSVYVVWEDEVYGERDIYLNYSKDSGATWLSPPIRLDSGDLYGAHDSWKPQIACSGEYVYVVWYDVRNYETDIYFNCSHNGGIHWMIPDIRLDTGEAAGAHDSSLPQIACSGNSVYVAWQDWRNGDVDIYFNQSGDNGVTWQSSATRLDTGDTAGSHRSDYPQISCDGNNVYVTWEDSRNGSDDIYFNYSMDNGTSWQPSDFRLDTGDTAGLNYSFQPQIAAVGSHVYVVWSDNRNGLYDIYFNRAIPQTDIQANGSDGPISITQSDSLQIKISLNTYGSTANADFWLAYKTASGWFYYNNSTKAWESGLGVTHQGALMELNNKKVFQSKLSPGNYTFYFGVDLTMDGKITKSSLYKDEVQVTVTQ